MRVNLNEKSSYDEYQSQSHEDMQVETAKEENLSDMVSRKSLNFLERKRMS